MAEKRAIGRGGRGAAILQALEELKLSNPGFSQKNEEDFVPPRPIGRSKALELSLKKCQSPGMNGACQPAKNFERSKGRGAYLENFLKGAQEEKNPFHIAENSKLNQERVPESKDKNKFSKDPPDIDQVANNLTTIALKEKIFKEGSTGKKVPLTANYISLGLDPGQAVYEYDIKFIPSVDSKDLRFRLVKSHRDVFGATRSFDGCTMYLPHVLHSEEFVLKATHPVDASTIKIQVKYRRKKRMEDCIHLLNIIFKKIMLNLQMVRFGKYLFDPILSSHIPKHKLEVWPGLISSVNVFDGGIQLCCDATHRVLRTQTVYEIMQEISVINPRYYRNECLKKLIGTSVLTRYNNKLYRIDDIMWDKSPNDTFQLRNSDEISFNDYYYKNYNIKIMDRNQPLLINKHKSKADPLKEEVMICLIPELCYMTGLTEDMKKDFHLMKDIAVYTRISPEQRQNALHKFFKQIRENPQSTELLKAWGLTLMPETVKIMGRQLDTEKIITGNQAN